MMPHRSFSYFEVSYLFITILHRLPVMQTEDHQLLAIAEHVKFSSSQQSLYALLGPVYVPSPLQSNKIYSRPEALRVMTISFGFVQHNFCAFINGFFGITSPFVNCPIHLIQHKLKIIDDIFPICK
jgi:hypothetical protein